MHRRSPICRHVRQFDPTLGKWPVCRAAVSVKGVHREGRQISVNRVYGILTVVQEARALHLRCILASSTKTQACLVEKDGAQIWRNY